MAVAESKSKSQVDQSTDSLFLSLQVGFLYGSLVEDYFTGFHLHCRGWTSAYCDPPLKPAFLGNAPTNFHDTLVQHKRWMTGLLEVGVSKYCPLIFGMRISSWRSTLQSMCYAWLAFDALYAFPLLVYGIVPQLCFSKGVAVFPAVRVRTFYLCLISRKTIENFFRT